MQELWLDLDKEDVHAEEREKLRLAISSWRKMTRAEKDSCAAKRTKHKVYSVWKMSVTLGNVIFRKNSNQ